jgi:hypothetical protein
MKPDKSTRSSKVFAAGCTIANPFLLCRVTAVYARRLQTQRVQFAQSINESLRLISDLPRGQMDTTNLPLPVVDDAHLPLPVHDAEAREMAAAAIAVTL